MRHPSPHSGPTGFVAPTLASALVCVVMLLGLLPSRAVAQSATAAACPVVDGTAAAGLAFEHRRFATPERHEPEIMGTGVAWLDFDGDGWQDLYVVHNGPYPPPARTPSTAWNQGPAEAANRLWRNRGDGTFEDVTDRAGAAGHRGYGQGVTAADVDGDGATDLYLSNYGPDALLLNRGDGTFADATADAGLGLDGWSSAAAFADGDGDGDLDLYVTRYMDYAPDHGFFCGDAETGVRTYCDPSLFLGLTDRYYVNRLAETGKLAFDDATEPAGLSGADGRGMGVLFGDLDGDGAADLYVSNDLNTNNLFRNRGDGTFEDLSLLSGAAVSREGKPEAGMGLVAADFDRDGDDDLAVTNFDVETNTYYRNLGGLQFEDASAATGFGVPSFNFVGFGIVAEDLDGDGALDVFVANGHIFEKPKRADISFRQRAQILLGDGRGRFRELDCPVLAENPAVGRGLAVGDPDRDGGPDLALLDNGGPFRFLETPARERFLAVELAGDGGSRDGANRDGIGALVTLETSAGASGRQSRRIRSGDSYQSSSQRLALFAVPEGEEVVALTVAWPDGGVRRLTGPGLAASVGRGAGRGRYLSIDR